MSCWARNGAETMYKCNGDTLERFDVNAEALDVFGGGLTCCTRGHPDGDPCDKEALVLPMLGLFAELYENRHREGKVASLSFDDRGGVVSPGSTHDDDEESKAGGDGVAETISPASPRPSFTALEPLPTLASAARGRPSYATVEPLLERLYPRTFEWSRIDPNGATVSVEAPLFGDLVDAVMHFADHPQDSAPDVDFAPGTNARRRNPKAHTSKHGQRGLFSMLKTRARSVSLSTSYTSTSHGSHGSRHSRHASLRSAKTSPSVGRKSFRHGRSG